MKGSIIDCHFYFIWIPENIIIPPDCAAIKYTFHDFKRLERYLTEKDFVWLPSNFKRSNTISDNLNFMNYEIMDKI